MLQIFAVAFFVLAGILTVPGSTYAAPAAGSLFKAPEFSAVYTMGGDGKRHVFPIEAVYKSWYGENWSMHRTISLFEVSNLMLGRNIVYKPGTLVKIPSVPKVYYVKEVSNDHDLAYIEWIPTESEFNSRGFRIRDIKDLPEPFFPGHYVELPNNNPVVNAQAAEDGNDFDHDTIPDVIDNCPINANTNQSDIDSDRVGDACDSYDNRQTPVQPNNDFDHDTIPDSIDNCPVLANQNQADADSDRVGDVCDSYDNRQIQPEPNNDFDHDTIPDSVDNCPINANTNQSDIDSDRVGDVCDSYDNRPPVIPPPTDTDHDTIPDSVDNCPTVANTSQADVDSDRIGDACDNHDDRIQPLVPPALYIDPLSCDAPNSIRIKAVAAYSMKLKFVYGVDGSSINKTVESTMRLNPEIVLSDLVLLTHYRGALTVTNQEGAFYTTNSVVFKLYKDSSTCKIVFFEGGAGWNTREISVKPAVADADGDKLCDADEAKYGTNPNIKDTDADGISDYDEVLVHYSDPLKTDTDGDGLGDKDEIINKTYPRITDSDYDGLNDYKEVMTYHTNPLAKDTDKDGVYDSTEIANGTNPLSSASK